MTSRLFREVREKRGLAYTVFGTFYALEHGTYFYGGTTTKNERARESFDVASAEIRDVALNGLNEEELEKGKTYLIGSYPLRFDTSAKIASQLDPHPARGPGARLARRAQPRDRRRHDGERKRAANRAFGDGSLLTTVVGTAGGVLRFRSRRALFANPFLFDGDPRAGLQRGSNHGPNCLHRLFGDGDIDILVSQKNILKGKFLVGDNHFILIWLHFGFVRRDVLRGIIQRVDLRRRALGDRIPFRPKHALSRRQRLLKHCAPVRTGASRRRRRCLNHRLSPYLEEAPGFWAVAVL